MKKLLALAMVAGAVSLYSCNNGKTEGTSESKDSVKTDTTTTPAPAADISKKMDADTSKKMESTTTEKKTEVKEEKKTEKK